MLYRNCVKPSLDILLAMGMLIVLSPVILLLMVSGAIAMKGNPFFVQERPGRNEKIFRLVKFRTMTNEKDADGQLLPDELRFNGYGRWLRAMSLDELPQMWNILKGEMSFVGPRPLLASYITLYSKEQRRRHDVRPGISGWAQVNGRNEISWEQKFERDVWYVENVSFPLDIKIIWMTIENVLKKQGINTTEGTTMLEFRGAVGASGSEDAGFEAKNMERAKG